jgi:protein required for attachment to host cells
MSGQKNQQYIARGITEKKTANAQSNCPKRFSEMAHDKNEYGTRLALIESSRNEVTMFTHWFAVASQKEVKIFIEVPEPKRIKLLKVFSNPLGHERNRTLIKKQAGRGVKSVGRMGSVHYSETKKHDPHEEAVLQFAREFTNFLKMERQQGNFSLLTVVAEPHFLGKIRSAMGEKEKKLVIQWIKKDLQKAPQLQLLKVLLPENKKHEVEASSLNVS